MCPPLPQESWWSSTFTSVDTSTEVVNEFILLISCYSWKRIETFVHKPKNAIIKHRNETNMQSSNLTPSAGSMNRILQVFLPVLQLRLRWKPQLTLGLLLLRITSSSCSFSSHNINFCGEFNKAKTAPHQLDKTRCNRLGISTQDAARAPWHPNGLWEKRKMAAQL